MLCLNLDNLRNVLLNTFANHYSQGCNYHWGFLGGGEKKPEREREGGMRRKTESQLQLVLIIDHDTLSWLLVHYKSLLSVLVTVQSKSKSQAAAEASSYITLCYSNSILSLLQLCYSTHWGTQVLCRFFSCPSLVPKWKPIKRLEFLFSFFRAYTGQIPMQSFMFHCKWKWRFADKAKK